MISCPKCKQGKLSRVRRSGWLQQRFFPRLGYYPWKCDDCSERVMLRRRDDAAWAPPSTSRLRSS